MQYVGFRPFKWQYDVIKDCCPNMRGANTLKAKPSVYVVKSRRQCGKSVMCENILLYYALNFGGGVSAAVSPTLNQSRKLFKDIVNAVGESGVIARKNESLLEITFENGSQIFFKSAEQKDGLRGYTLKWGILILDECAYIGEDVLELVMPWVQVHHCPILMLSTPKFKTGFFWRYYSMGSDPDNKKIRVYDWARYDTSALLSVEQMEEYRNLFPASQFKSEYLGEFLDDSDSVFKGFRECVFQPEGEYRTLYVGVDWGTGTGSDYTVVSALDENGKQRVLMRFNDKTTTEQVEIIRDFIIINKDRISKVVCETNGLGQPMTDSLKKELKRTFTRIEEFYTSNTSKNDIINALQVAFEKKKIGIMGNDAQLNELTVYALEYNVKTQTVTFNAPQGLHDDSVIALALAYKAYSEGSGSAYSLKFAKK